MLTVAYVFAALAAAVHVYIFWLEALVFETVGRKVFGVSAQDAAIMKPWAFNQGFYNVFLAIGVVAGLALASDNRDAGIAVLVLATGSMASAALVLIGSDRTKARGAIVQGLFPVIALVAFALWAYA